jgi:undecaprenyl-diphosphatase
MTLVEAVLIAIIEGLTEYLPISSTAHMVFASSILGIQEDAFVKMFQVSIQFGAILAVVALYWKKFFDFSRWSFYIKLAFAVVPALVLGYFFDDAIEQVLEKPIPIAIVLVIGGVVLLFVDRWFKEPLIHAENDITIPTAVKIGFWQCLAMMPGTSRAAASIIGGMQQKLNRETAAEFSFFLAVPTMLAVTSYSVFLKNWSESETEKLKGYQMIMQDQNNLLMFGIGNVIAFVVAVIAIRFFIGLLKKHGFALWGWYRIIAGIALIAYFSFYA